MDERVSEGYSLDAFLGMAVRGRSRDFLPFFLLSLVSLLPEIVDSVATGFDPFHDPSNQHWVLASGKSRPGNPSRFQQRWQLLPMPSDDLWKVSSGWARDIGRDTKFSSWIVSRLARDHRGFNLSRAPHRFFCRTVGSSGLSFALSCRCH